MTEQEKRDIALIERGGRKHNMLMTLSLERRTEAVCRRAVEIAGENIRYVPRDMRTEKMCYTAVRSWDYALDYVPEKLKTPRMCRAAVEHYGPALLFVPQEHRTAALCKAAVKNDVWALPYVPDGIKTRKMCMDAVTKDGWVLEFVPQAMKTPQMCREALNAPLAKLREHRSVLQFIRYADVCLEGIRKYRQKGADMVGLLADIEPEVMDERIALYGVESDPACLMALPGRWKTEAVCEAAVRGDGIMLHDVPEHLRTKRMCEAAVLSSVHALPYVPEALHTPDLYREAMENDPAAIQYFKPELLTREICLDALARTDDLGLLRHIPYKEIHEQVLERCEGYSQTKHFLDSMNPDYMTPKLAEMIFTKEPELFCNIPEKFKDRELCETAVRYDGSYLRMVPEALKTPELCREAIRRSPYAIPFIPEAMKSPELYMDLVKENPLNLRGIPKNDRTYEMCKEAFDNTYGKDKTDYSVAGALTEPTLALQMVREQDDPRMIDFLMDVMPRKAISEEVALEAVRKNGEILPLVPENVITQQVGEVAVKNHPQAIQWVPREMRTADMCLRAECADPAMKVYVPEHIAQGDNIYSFRAEADDLIRRPLGYDDYKRLYAGEAAHVPDVQSPGGSMGPCRVYFDTQKRHFVVEQLDDQPPKQESRPAKTLHTLFKGKRKAGPKHSF